MAIAMGKNLLKDALSDPPGSRFKLYNQINIESFFCIKGQYMYPFFSNAVKVYRLPMLIASNVQAAIQLCQQAGSKVQVEIKRQALAMARMSSLRPKLLIPLVAGACILTPAKASSEKVWVTLDSAAYTQLQKLVPELVAAQSQISVGNAGSSSSASAIPEDTRSTPKLTPEPMHIVEVEKSILPRLSKAIYNDESNSSHSYTLHSSREAAVAVLQGPPTLVGIRRPSYTIDNQAIVNPLLAQMQDSNIASMIADLSSHPNRYYTSPHGVRASNWLMRRWQWMAAGRSDVTVEQFNHRAFPQKSVILTINGTDNADEVVVLGGHIDTVTETSAIDANHLAPGADDNASGIASLTEAMRVMLNANYRPRRTIKFIAYAAEEAGLLGSQDIADKFTADNVKVVGVLQLDMTNHKGAAKDIYIFEGHTDSQQNTFLANLINTYLPTLTVGYGRCGRCSDHVAWHDRGYWASMPSEASADKINPHIHSANDTYANTGNQALHALKFSRLGLAFAVELGSD